MNELFTEIRDYLVVERKWSKLMADRYIEDFTAPWRHQKELAPAPDWYVQEYMALERKDKKASVSLRGNGWEIQRDESNNLVILQTGGHYVTIPGSEYYAFLTAMMSIPQGNTTPPKPSLGTVGYGGVSSAPVLTNNLQNDDRPEIQHTMERNLKELEKFALASSTAYPRSK